MRVGRGFGKLAWKGVKSEVWAFAAFAMLMLHLLFLSCRMVVGLRCPSFEGFWEGQKVRGFGIGLAAAFAPEVKGLGWAVAAAFALADSASGRPGWRRGGLVSLCKSAKNPKVWAWGWLPPSPLG